MRVAQLMTPNPTVLKPGQHLRRAADELRESRIRHLPVVDDSGVLVGLISQRDLSAAGDQPERLVKDVMHTDIKTVGPDTPAHEAAYLILRHTIGCVPIVGPAGELVGIITETDFVRAAYSLLGGTVPVDDLEREEREADAV